MGKQQRCVFLCSTSALALVVNFIVYRSGFECMNLIDRAALHARNKYNSKEFAQIHTTRVGSTSRKVLFVMDCFPSKNNSYHMIYYS